MSLREHPGTNTDPGATPEDADYHTWTGKARGWLLRRLPADKLLPEDQPSYVASWIYVFGMGAIVSLVFILASGVILGLNGPAWYHVSDLGHFVNSVHLWSVELFFMTMVVHLWGKYWMAAWRGGRALTWITGMGAFLVSIVTAFTGYLLQTNFDSQWIAFEGKDALNAAGIGAWFNVANLGQIFMFHIILLPLAVGAVVALHVVLVRMHGVVPPLEAAETDAQLQRGAQGDTGEAGR
ncbi:ubiquinol-cytochrome c reductase cytochrome b subunit [Cryobacterium sp. MP_M5]|uniref:cytochrome b N-terminal domain-containing protein n=1 Tax=unclassified Cryobacterium TaxID=2649013 RepID=UPI0018C932B2|nr:MULTISPECIES: cytochrome b N-terminal domain-containing protein [unclassified Cryobacterium]MBG6058451.1 ubiquinol-cytochrome c reductase cytochrome b subunit [Cryobacterium sp. MP_M3]MEC5176897.1 ubiquinol-cytochrome c reductase cytochrome b subunit [Cryobacterium sp. MP_M5]